MSKLIGGSKIYGSLTANGSIIAPCGAGFQNIVALTSGSSYTLPSQLIVGAKFKVTIIGAGGGGGGHSASTNSMTGGGGSGGVLVVILTYVAGVGSFSYSVGGGGSGGTAGSGSSGGDSTVTYNGITYTAGGGGGGGFSAVSVLPSPGAGGTNSCTTPALIAMANGLTNCLNISGFLGKRGSDGQTIRRGASFGGNTPLDWGQGGVVLGGNDASIKNGVNGTGYGSGGSGSHPAQTASAGTGGSGASGIIILEY